MKPPSFAIHSMTSFIGGGLLGSIVVLCITEYSIFHSSSSNTSLHGALGSIRALYVSHNIRHATIAYTESAFFILSTSFSCSSSIRQPLFRTK